MASIGDIFDITANKATKDIFQASQNKPIDSSEQNSTTLVNSFESLLNDNLNKVDNLQKQSEEMGVKLASGEVDNIHDVMLMAQKAKIALDLTVQVRNLVLSAYEKLTQMR